MNEMLHTPEMKFKAQQIVYAYCAYLLRYRDTYKTPSGSKFFTHDFRYGFKGKSLLPYVFMSLKGIAVYNQPYTTLVLPKGTLIVSPVLYTIS